MKLKADVLQVKEKSGTWDGKAYTNHNATLTLFDLSGNFFGMAEGVRLPDALKGIRPGKFDAEISFEYKTDKRAFVPVIEGLTPAKA